MRRLSDRAASLALAAALALTLTACDADEAAIDPPAGQDDGGPAVRDDADADAESDDAEVVAVDIAFSPASVTVPVRGAVTWTNQDAVPHTVTAGQPDDPDGDFDEPLDVEGGAATVTFDEPGTFVYHCRLHPSMTGEVVAE